MKKIAFIFLSLILISLGCTEPDDLYEDNMSEPQLKSAETRTYQWVSESGYYTPLLCDGLEVGFLTGYLHAHWRVHYKDGLPVWAIINFNGTLTNQDGTVTYTIKETDKFDVIPGVNWINYVVRWNIKGSDGSHYVGSGMVDTEDPYWPIIPMKSLCPPSND